MPGRSRSVLAITIGVGLIGVASALPAIRDAAIAQVALPQDWSSMVVAAVNLLAVALGAFGILLVAFSPIASLNILDFLRIIRMRVGARLLGVADATVGFDVVPVLPSDLKDLRDFCLRTIGPGISALKKMQRWHDHNPHIWWKVVAARGGLGAPDRVERIHGYYGLIPINAGAATALDQEQLDGASFTTAHICTPAEVPVAFYIAGLAADHQVARTKVIRSLRAHVERLVADNPATFYTRPFTKIGLALVRNLNFKRMDGSAEYAPEEIYKGTVSISDLAQRIGKA
jgi:hypothetical protein